MRHRQRLRNPTLWLRALSALQPARHTSGLPGSQVRARPSQTQGGVQDVSERDRFRSRSSASRPVTDRTEHGPSQPDCTACGVGRLIALDRPRAKSLTALVDGHRAISCSTWCETTTSRYMRCQSRSPYKSVKQSGDGQFDGPARRLGSRPHDRWAAGNSAPIMRSGLDCADSLSALSSESGSSWL